MKKLRLSSIFHWLYAILMFLPFIMLFCNIILLFGNYPVSGVEGSYEPLPDAVYIFLGNSIPFDLFGNGMFSDVHSSIVDVVTFFTGWDGDTTNINVSVTYLFVYWIEVSFLYLMFDLVMFPINLAHRWIDKGGLE